LKDIKFSAGSVSFVPETFSYKVDVENKIKSVKATPTAQNEKAELKINGADIGSGEESQSFDVETNGYVTITIDVRSENGKNKRTYVFNVAQLGAAGVYESYFDQSVFEGSRFNK